MRAIVFFYLFFSPYTIVVLYLLCFFLYDLRLSNELTKASSFTRIYIYLSILSFLAGILTSNIIKAKEKVVYAKILLIYRRSIFKILLFISILSLVFYFSEHLYFIYRYKYPPIFHPDFELLRFYFPISGYIHFLAMLCYPSLYILSSILILNPRIFPKIYTYYIYIVSIIVILLGLMIGSRGNVVNFLVPLTIVYFLQKNNFRKKLGFKIIFGFVLFSFLGVYLLGFFKLLRDYLFYGRSVLSAISQNWIFNDYFFTYPLYFSYLAIAMSFNILNMYIVELKDFYYGYFTFVLPFYSLLPGKQFSLKDLQSQVLGIDFHGTLTGTIFLIPYIDFGIVGSIIFFFFGFVFQHIFIGVKKYLKTGMQSKYLIIYPYLFWLFALGVYGYPFGAFYMLFNIFSITFLARLYEKKVFMKC